MSVTLRSIIIAALLSIVAGLMYRYSALTGQLSNAEIQVRYPTFEARNFTAEVYTDKGTITHSIFAHSVSFYKNRDLVRTTGLIGFFYNNEKNNVSQGWQLRSDQGEVIFNKEASLNGNIRITPNFPTATIKEITTPYVYFDMEKNVISSTSKITIKGQNFVNEGSDYSVDLNRKTFVIKDRPHAVYYP